MCTTGWLVGLYSSIQFCYDPRVPARYFSLLDLQLLKDRCVISTLILPPVLLLILKLPVGMWIFTTNTSYYCELVLENGSH